MAPGRGLGIGGGSWDTVTGTPGVTRTSGWGGGLGVSLPWGPTSLSSRAPSQPLWLLGGGSLGRRSVLRRSGRGPGQCAQRCSLQVEGWGTLRLIRFRLSPKHGEVYRASPCAQHPWSGFSEPEDSPYPSTPTPGVLAGNIRTLTPALCTALKETEAQRAEGMAGTTHSKSGQGFRVAQSSGPSQAAFRQGWATPPHRPPKPLLLPRVELIRTSASQPTPCHLLIYVSSL